MRKSGPLQPPWPFNLLPDNPRIRARLGTRFMLKSTDTFDLLEAIGRDCVGAVQLLPEEASPQGWNRITCEPQTEEQLVAHLMAVRTTNAHYHFDAIHAWHWRRLALKNGGLALWGAMQALVGSVDSALARVESKLAPDFPARTWNAIAAGMKSEAKRFFAEADLNPRDVPPGC